MNQKPILKELRWGVIGCGDVCEIKSAPAMNKIEHSQLIGVMRRDEAKIKDYAKRHQVPKWYTNADQLINDPDINSVYIATPPHLHKLYAQAAARAGKPVYVEKPMALSYRECQDMIQICEENAVSLFVAYYRRSLPHFLQVKQWLEDGLIGNVRSVQIELFQSIKPAVFKQVQKEWRVQPEIAGGGYFFDLASHQLDFLDYLFGPIIRAGGMKKNQAGLYPAEDIVTASFVFENGVMGSGQWCFTVAENAQKELTTIRGTEGYLQFHFFTGTTIQIQSNRLNQRVSFELPVHIQQPLIQSIVDELRGVGSCPSSGTTAARTNWVIEQILK